MLWVLNKHLVCEEKMYLAFVKEKATEGRVVESLF